MVVTGTFTQILAVGLTVGTLATKPDCTTAAISATDEEDPEYRYLGIHTSVRQQQQEDTGPGLPTYAVPRPLDPPKSETTSTSKTDIQPAKSITPASRAIPSAACMHHSIGDKPF